MFLRGVGSEGVNCCTVFAMTDSLLRCVRNDGVTFIFIENALYLPNLKKDKKPQKKSSSKYMKELLQIAIKAAIAAGAEIMNVYAGKIAVTLKRIVPL